MVAKSLQATSTALSSSLIEDNFSLLKQFVFPFLNCKDIIHICSTNKNLSKIANDEELWKQILIRDFGREEFSALHGYKTTYKLLDSCKKTTAIFLQTIKKHPELFAVLGNKNPAKLELYQILEKYPDPNDQTRIDLLWKLLPKALKILKDKDLASYIIHQHPDRTVVEYLCKLHHLLIVNRKRKDPPRSEEYFL